MAGRLALLLAGLALACTDGGGPLVPADTPPPLGWVDVRLGTGAGPPTVAADGPFLVLDAQGTERGRGLSLPAGTPVALLDDGQVLLGSVPLGPPPVELRPGGSTRLSCAGVHYRGSLLVERSDDGPEPRLINRLAVDDYLRGVLPAEMPDRFGLEALKAQAVAARSYALSQVDRRGWLFADVRSQAYGGADAETVICSRAVDETAGQVLVAGGRVLPAWFHSTCGGLTVPAREVFDDVPPGVLEHGVTCPDCRRSPTWSWTRRLDGPSVCRALDLPEGPLDSVVGVPGLYPGRPRRVVVRAGGRTLDLDADVFRSRVSAGRPFDQQLLSTLWARPARVVDGDLLVDGRGWGHGVGLCQYGAAGYAERGASYRAILLRYYGGAELVRLQ